MSEQAGCGSGRGELWFSDTLPICQKERKEKREGKVAGREREREREETESVQVSSPVGNTTMLNYTSLVLALFAVLCLLLPADAPLMPHRP